MSIVHDAGNELCLFALDSEVGNKFIFEVSFTVLFVSGLVPAMSCTWLLPASTASLKVSHSATKQSILEPLELGLSLLLALCLQRCVQVGELRFRGLDFWWRLNVSL